MKYKRYLTNKILWWIYTQSVKGVERLVDVHYDFMVKLLVLAFFLNLFDLFYNFFLSHNTQLLKRSSFWSFKHTNCSVIINLLLLEFMSNLIKFFVSFLFIESKVLACVLFAIIPVLVNVYFFLHYSLECLGIVQFHSLFIDHVFNFLDSCSFLVLVVNISIVAEDSGLPALWINSPLTSLLSLNGLHHWWSVNKDRDQNLCTLVLGTCWC